MKESPEVPWPPTVEELEQAYRANYQEVMLLQIAEDAAVRVIAILNDFEQSILMILNHIRSSGLTHLLKASKEKLGEVVALLVKSGASLVIWLPQST